VSESPLRRASLVLDCGVVSEGPSSQEILEEIEKLRAELAEIRALMEANFYAIAGPLAEVVASTRQADGD
jgi:hypothetical protein